MCLRSYQKNSLSKETERIGSMSVHIHSFAYAVDPSLRIQNILQICGCWRTCRHSAHHWCAGITCSSSSNDDYNRRCECIALCAPQWRRSTSNIGRDIKLLLPSPFILSASYNFQWHRLTSALCVHGCMCLMQPSQNTVTFIFEVCFVT